MEKQRGLLSQSGFGLFGLLEVIVVLLMVAVFFYVLPSIVKNAKPGGLLDKDARKEMAREGINTASYETTVDSVNSKLKGIQAQLADRKSQMLENS